MYRIPINPSVIPSTHVRMIFASALTMIAITSAIVHTTIPATIIGTALRMMAIILDSPYGNVAII